MQCLIDIPTGDRDKAARWIQKLLALSAEIAAHEIKIHNLPPLYKSGVGFVAQKPGVQIFRSPVEVLKRKGGDCKMLTAWRLAELNDGSTPAVMWPRRAQGWQAHARIRRGDGTVEDPSVELGMVDRRRRSER